MSKFISIAIDGPSGAGKSTLAKMVAKTFNFIYVDTGAIYRTVGLYCLRNGIICKDESGVSSALANINISIEYDYDGKQMMILNGENVSEAIRMPEVSIAASDVSSLAVCRTFLLDMQRRFARENNVIMDGRDIGTVVLPNADIKIFLTSSAEVRAQRRFDELSAKGITTTFDEVLKDIEYRDYQDTHREVAPLKQAEDAVLVDTSNLNLEESLDYICSIIVAKIV